MTPHSTPPMMSNCFTPNKIHGHLAGDELYAGPPLARSSNWPLVATPCLANMGFIMAVAMASMPGIDETSVGIGMAGFPKGEIFSWYALSFLMISNPKDRYIDIHGCGRGGKDQWRG